MNVVLHGVCGMLLCVALLLGLCAAIAFGDDASLRPDDPILSDRLQLSQIVSQHDELLRAQLAHARRDLAEVSQRIQDVRRETERLWNLIAAIKGRVELPTDNPEEAGPRKVQFRQPIAHPGKPQKVHVFCVEDKCFFEDPDAIRETLRKRRETIAEGKDTPETLEQAKTEEGNSTMLDVPRGDFNLVEILRTQNGQGYIRYYILARKADAQGETAVEAGIATSTFLRQIADISPATTDVLFYVYPDSFAVFRELRAIAWQKGFAVGWVPMDVGEELVIGRGNRHIAL